MAAKNIKQATHELLQVAKIKPKKKSLLQISKNKSVKECLDATKKSDLKHFYISSDTTLTGKPQEIFATKSRINLVHKLEIPEGESVKIVYKFLNESVDGRDLRAYGKKSLTSEFFLYKLVSGDREFVVLSTKKLPSVEQEFLGMKLSSATQTEVAKRFSLRGFINLFFVAESTPTIKVLSIEQLFKVTKDFSRESFLNYLFYHSGDKRIYNQPEDYKKLIFSVLFSGKQDNYPLHLITIGAAGVGKTMKQESLNLKFEESQGIFEASASRLKGLIPSFKEKPASLGYLLSCNRIALVDELFKMIESAMNDSHFSSSTIANALQQLNPILEHKKRTVASGNDNAFLMHPTAKLIADCNPLSTKANLPEHLSVLDSTTLSRCLLWVIDQQHYNKIQQYKEQYLTLAVCSGNIPNTLKYNTFLSIYDTLNSFTCKMSQKDVVRIFNGATTTLRDDRLRTLWKARGLHHTYLIVDGLTKLRCLFGGDPSFKSQVADFDEAEELLIRILQTMQSTFGRDTSGISTIP